MATCYHSSNTIAVASGRLGNRQGTFAILFSTTDNPIPTTYKSALATNIDLLGPHSQITFPEHFPRTNIQNTQHSRFNPQKMRNQCPQRILAIGASYMARADNDSFPNLLNGPRPLQRYLLLLLIHVQEADAECAYDLNPGRIEWSNANDLADDLLAAAHQVRQMNEACECPQNPATCGAERKIMAKMVHELMEEAGIEQSETSEKIESNE